MRLNPREQEGEIALGFAGLQDGAFSMAGPASGRAVLAFCFGPRRAGIWVERLLQALGAVLGFCFCPQRARMVAWSDPSTPIPVGSCVCSRHGADVLRIFCPSSPPAALNVERVCMGARSPWIWGCCRGPRESDPSTEGGCTRLVTTAGFADAPCPVQAVVSGQHTAVPVVRRPLRGRSAGKRLTGKKQARLWLPAPDPALGWGAAGSCNTGAKIAI